MHLQLRLTGALVATLCAWACTAEAQVYHARLDATQVRNNESDSTATGVARFQLDATGSRLSYQLDLDGVDLEPIAANRTDPDDVLAIHIHLHVADVIGPHILNIFGNPSEDDADLVVDFENESLSGVFDASDSLDPATGEPFFVDDPLATKLIDDWLDELDAGQLYIAVHTRRIADVAPPGVAIRGDIFRVPEPSVWWMLVAPFIFASRHNRYTVS